MKDKVILLFIILNISLFSQSNFSGGFKFGVSLPNVSLNNKLQNTNIEISNKLGFNTGIFVNTISAGAYYLSSEIYYNQSFVNVKTSYLYSQSMENIDYKVEYIVYGLISKFHFTNSLIKPYLFAGPTLSFYISDNPTSSSFTIPGATLIKISDNLNKTIFSISIGAGFEIKVSNKLSVLAEGQFVPGVMNSYEEASISAKTNSLEFKCGIKINY